MWLQTRGETCPILKSKVRIPFGISSTLTQVVVTSMRMHVDPEMPYLHFVLPTLWHQNHSELVHTPFDTMSVSVRNVHTGASLAYPPLHVHHVHVNTDFHWFEVHGDYYPDEYTRRTPDGTSIAMHTAPTIEGVLNLVPSWTGPGLDVLVQVSFRRADPRATRPIAKLWFQAQLQDDWQCWARYTVPNVASYSVWTGTFATSGTFLTGWLHTHRARSKSIFLFRGDLPDLVVDEDVEAGMRVGSHFAKVKDVSGLEALAQSRKSLLCHEIHTTPADASVVINGTAYDRHGHLTCVPRFRFSAGERWSILIVHLPMFHRDATVFQHSNIFMYADTENATQHGRALLNSGSFAYVRDL